ncbi:mannan endo-1,4-beta-mannosidase [Flaviramulus basaltis]|uniref:Mannan endo-1,4-beta-mannosidase n=1 Tax=Flaviramulus basaltis TaxID=369401 RepID=A0A1K2IP29_9FLAO|nr:glycosyl hydrolase [Flaviramulus basaltis]SFZ93451.1 mannan endo-1,4-beta-mannosidase [Flaviramulus basaltis]
MKNFKLIFSVLLIAIFFNSCSKDSPEENPEPATNAIKVSISTATNIVVEPSLNGAFTVTLSEGISKATKVSYTVSGTATNGEDFETISNSLTIPANTLSSVIAINVLDDNISEDNETIIITLTSTDNANVVLNSSKTATITISSNAESFSLNPEDTSTYMVNPNATPETIALFYNLKNVSRTNFIIGQQDAFNSFYNNNVGDSDIKKTTGNDPGLLGSDFMFIADDNNDGTASNWWYQQEQKIKADAIEAYNKGMVNVFMWHLREPYEGEHFYTSDMTVFQKNNAFKSILPGGDNHEYYKEKLQIVADVANNLVGNDGKLIPFIFRPFHEFDGDWFWWGASYCTPQEYITLWQFTVEYLRDTLNVNNMLFAFSPDRNFNSESEYLNRYPGDNYVDILGMDNYGDLNNMGQSGIDTANEKLQIIDKLAKEKVKIAAFTETGYFVTPGQNNPISGFYANNLYQVITNNSIEIAFMMFWNNTEDTYVTPVPGMSSASDFIGFTNKPKSLLQNELPNMYVLPN